MPMPEAMLSKSHAIRYRAAILISLPFKVVMRTIYPALPRIGTDFMTLRVVLRIVHKHNPLAAISF
jgi:hypothetical protein